MRWPWVSREQYELALKIDKDTISFLLREEQIAVSRAEAAEKRYDKLMDAYMALRVSGADPAPVIPEPPKSPYDQFGPLTRAALYDMGHGQSGIVKRKMRDVALGIWLESRGNENQDEMTAIAVRQGETRR